jgi:hypothetical protein
MSATSHGAPSHGPEAATVADVTYLVGFAVAFVALSFVRTGILYVAYAVLFLSLFQDWRSARVAEARVGWFLPLLDKLTVLNYVGAFAALVLSPDPGLGYSARLWLHWGFVFLVYILWNVAMARMPGTDKPSRDFFRLFSLAEVPVAAVCFAVFAEAKTHLLAGLAGVNLAKCSQWLVMGVGCVHLAILSYWVVRTYSGKSR